MKIQIKPSDIKVLEEAFDGDERVSEILLGIKRQINFDKASIVTFQYDQVPEDLQKQLRAHLSKIGNRTIINQLNVYDRLATDPNIKINRLIHIVDAVRAWVLLDCTKGWIFEEKDGDFQAWVISSVGFERPTHGNPYVTITLDANKPRLKTDRERHRHSISINQDDLPGSIGEILLAKGYHHESADMHAMYEAQVERYREVVAQPNQQFWLQQGIYAPAKGYQKLDLKGQHRAVNDEELVERFIRSEPDYPYWSKSSEADQIPEGAFSEIPLHFSHLMFDLQIHEHLWAPTSSLMNYVYNRDAAEKIVLPDDHRELIDILTEDEDVLIEDVVEGKSGGNIILLKGEAGLGKTLLVETYCEKIARILYPNQAGQLGLDAATVEKQIANIYANAGRWNAVTFIDEADVYVRRRGDDMQHNSILAAMLIALERQNVLTFLATNRENDIDEAIVSRCLAIVKFQAPPAKDAAKIWRIQADQIGLDISDDTINTLVNHYETSDRKTAGRDIRALLKLAYRYKKRRNIEPTAEKIIQLGAFKGF